MPQKLIQIINKIGGEVSHRKAQGRDYLVAPMVAVRSQVLNGMYLPPEELEASLLGWDDVPITHNHPDFSARDPDIPKMGRFYNATFEDNSLKGEAWYDLELVADHGEAGEELINRLEAGETIEVSTGYYASLEWQDGTFEDEEYWAIQRDLIPDHIATLLHDIGACSVEDGCGVPRRNEQNNNDRVLIQQEEHMPKKRALLQAANGLLKLLGADEIEMADEELDEELDLDEDLEDEDDDVGADDLAGEEDGGEGDEEDEAEPAAEPVAQAQTPEWMNELGEIVNEIGLDGVRDALAAGAHEQRTTRAQIIHDLAGCSRCQFSKAELKKMSTPILRKLQASLNGVDYSARGGGQSNGGGEQPLKAPSIFFKEKEEAKNE